ncbi:MAG: DUF4338 domain-containing protein [Candidatus Accumulibacter sp.]|uniref:Druantia anti-phage system protein DruA n=1 Tax=Accumulibacter sp. TaxID=2053492 RepID=UPI002588701D|nr:Druantia anti-phage system protein DruA [Accumulibacter sp.]MBK8115213.1 DUF4338 domain-containing protein [Accumulibacter sp.]
MRTPGLGDADGDGEDRRLPGVSEAFAGGRPARPAHTETLAATARDAWIGWTAQARRENLPRVLNNSRFLIFPHVRVPHLASHVLGQLARRARSDWLEHWGFEPLLLESFVDPRQHAGTCYRAAGWQLLGETSGRGLARPGRTYHSTPRQVWVKPLGSDGRDRLCSVAGLSRP